MKNPHQLFLAFFIPFAAALMLLSLGDYIFGWKLLASTAIIGHQKGEGVSFSEGYGKLFDFEDLYKLIIFSLFVLSAVLPFFVIARNQPIKTNKLGLNE